MATTVSTATLSVQIKEEITLNGTAYDQTITKSITGIGNVSKRIFTIPANTTATLAEFLSTSTGEEFDTEDTKYIRVTNLDDTNEVILTLAVTAAAGAIELKPTSSTTLFSINANGAGSKAAQTSIDAIEHMYIHNAHGSASVDVEVFIATA
jgi:hypothetical protein|tara:strand:+ start:1582 stop:2037 length:456 start_codon:yes stop_codon:yes gene_type:complete